MYQQRRYKARRPFFTGGRKLTKYRRWAPWRPRGRYRIQSRFSSSAAAAIRPEWKFVDVPVVAQVLPVGPSNVTGAVQSINVIPQGVLENERIGVKVIVRSIQISGFVTLIGQISGLPGNVNRVQLSVVVNSANNGAAASNLNDILDPPLPDGHRVVSHMNQWKVLWTRTFMLNTGAGAGDGINNDWAAKGYGFKMYKRCAIPLRFDGATGGVTELATNNIQFVAWNLVTPPVVVVDCNIRIRYSDN